MLYEGYWNPVPPTDDRLRGLHGRHYSSSRKPRYAVPKRIVGPGQVLCLLTTDGTAGFVWLKNTVERYDHQEGVICTFFRNEGTTRSSTLIQEADALAWQRWPNERLFTYVDGSQIQSSNPGYCFKMAGWSQCGLSQKGLVILEHVPVAG